MSTAQRAPLWSVGELVAAITGAFEIVTDIDGVTGVSIDTRTIQPGDLFVALKDVRDGHEFVPAAFKAGAAAALVGRGYQRQPGDGALIRVPDRLHALEALGRAARKRLAPTARVVAVTGSAGKTGTKEMLRVCLATAGRVHASEKSYNNHWGVPLTLARMPADTAFGVFEIGMNHPGEIAPLTRMVRPHVAIITNVLPVHIGNFPDGETGIANAKAEICAGLEPGGTVIIPRDSPHFALLADRAREAGAQVATFGMREGADARMTLALHGSNGDTPMTDIQATIGTRAIRYRIGVPGQHIAMNSLAVVLGLDQFDRLTDAALAQLRAIGPARGRGERTRFRTPAGPVLLIDEAYNANPASMQWALIGANVEVDVPFERCIAVLGDMLELGEGSGKFHTDLASFIAEAMENIEVVYACGPLMKHLHDALPPERRGAWTPTSAELIPHVLAELRAGDVVMVKGSLGSNMAPIVAAIRTHFSPGT